ncbi:MAG TPA: hypothetical protein VFG88_10585 [Nocardioidaceae bacterium]|nr:hypothetical protein [Nocardioidaceae bacterium]
MGPTATVKQESFIISLYNQVHGTAHGYLSQCDQLALNNRQKKGGMTKAEASTMIDQLKSEVDA